MPTFDEFMTELRDEMALENTGPFAEMMRSFDRHFGAYQRAELAQIEAETRRVESRTERVKQDKPMSRRTDA